MASAENFKSVQDGLQKSIVSVVKSANRIANEDLGFQRTVNPDVAQLLDDRSERLLSLSTRLLRSAANACGLKAPELEDAEDIDLNWRQVVDVVDTVLEKADTALDEYTGLIKRKEPPSTEAAPATKRQKPTGKVIRNAQISKPQLKFEVKPDNHPKRPWKPILTEKPHATVSLEDSLVTFKNDNSLDQYRHPYEKEIKAMEYPEQLFQKTKPTPFTPMDDSEAIYVDTFEGVLEMLEQLKQAKEIAVDLEHHDFRTYVGLVSLMQVSTRDQDWIVDTLQPWRHKLEVLNQVFADPSIVKVFHGSYSDMIWLQRDLGLYVVGLFDTYFASSLLSYPAKSLAYLLSKFADFDADKQYQLADWRLRPLQKEMLFYARSDTHFLLYVFDCLRNELLSAKNPEAPSETLMPEVLKKSKEVALLRHEHPVFDEETGQGTRGWYNLILKQGHLAYNGEQFAVFRALWKWRDEVARTEDENPNFVLGSTHVTEIAKINPPDKKALHSLLPMASPHARPKLNEIWEVVKEAKAKGGPSLLQFLTSTSPDFQGKQTAVPMASRWTATLPLPDGEILVSKLPQSQLFGSMPVSSRWELAVRSTANDSERVPFPWQRFVDTAAEAEAEDEDDAGDLTLIDAEPEPEVPATEEASEEPEDQEFTLKRGQKRKAAATSKEDTSSSDSSSSEDEEEEEEGEEEGGASVQPQEDDEEIGNDTIPFDDSSDEGPPKKRKKKNNNKSPANKLDIRAAKIERRQEKKKKKNESTTERKSRKQKEKKSEDAQQPKKKKEKFNAVPFDYSQAASVMNASRQESKKQGGGSGKKAVFDPYAKASESDIKGARKAMPVRGERSGTFKK